MSLLSNLKKPENLPNVLTMSRVVTIMFVVLLANVDHDKKNYIPISETFAYVCHVSAFILAVLAAFTDILDGYLARKYGWVSDFGALMDPLADKIFLVATSITFVDYNLIPAWIVVVIISREFLVTGLRLLATQKGTVISADKWGKLKTFMQMIMLLIAGFGWIHLFGLDLLYDRLGPFSVWFIWYIYLLLVALVTVLSGLGYFIRNREIIREIS